MLLLIKNWQPMKKHIQTKKLTAQLNETKKRTLQELLNAWLLDVYPEVVEGNGRKTLNF